MILIAQHWYIQFYLWYNASATAQSCTTPPPRGLMKMSFLRRSVFDRWKPRMLSSFSPQSMHSPQPVPAVEPDHSEVQALLNTLAGLDLNKVMARRKEPLVVPHYQLMSLEQLQQVNTNVSVVVNSRFVMSTCRFKKKLRRELRLCYSPHQYFQSELLVGQLLRWMKA